MSPPVQLWISGLSQSPHTGLDMHRALGAWKGEDRIWLIPRFPSSVRWESEVGIRYRKSHSPESAESLLPYRFRELAIPSETFNWIDVIYIDSERRVFAPGQDPPFNDFGSCLPERIYREWIEASPPLYVPSTGWKDFRVPCLREGKVEFELVHLAQQPGPILPITGFDEKKLFLSVRQTWPPPGSNLPSPVSPEAESISYYGQLEFKQQGEERYVTSANRTEERASHVNAVWPAPFDRFFPEGGGVDVLMARQQMRALVTRRETVPLEILPIAEPYFSEGESTLEKSWFFPRLCADGESNVLADMTTKYGWEDSSVAALVSKRVFGKTMHTTVPCRRIWGWLGYFWQEFLNDLYGGSYPGACQLCGIPIGGRKNKRYCTQDENPDCFRQRRALNRRGQRTRL